MAKEQAEQSEYCYKIGSILITKTGEIYRGFNKANKTHTRSNQEYKHIHAELQVLLKAGIHNKKKIAGSTMVLYRETSIGLACSKPCKFCEKILNEFNIKNIYYTDVDGYWHSNKRGEVQKLS